MRGECFGDQQLGPLRPPNQKTLRRFDRAGLAVHVPAIPRVQITFKRRHDRIRVSEIHDIDDPLSNSFAVLN